MVVFSAVLNCS